MKPDAKTLNTIGYKGKKVVLVEYSFDISGLTATAGETGKSGKYMVYDPTVTTIPNTVTVRTTDTSTGTASDTSRTQTASGAMRVGVNLIFLSGVLCFAGLSFS